MMLVSLEMASEHLRRDSADDDLDLVLKIKAASEAIVDYIKGGADFLNSDGDVNYDSFGTPLGVPNRVQLATLMLLGIYYRDRDGQEMEKWKQGYLPFAVTALLYPLRNPTYA